MTHHETIKQLLERLESELSAHQLWQSQIPAEHKLSSQQPFAVDTLEPHEWLQWIYIPKLQELVESKQVLPKGYLIAPYFEQTWIDLPHLGPLLDLLREIDEANKQC